MVVAPPSSQRGAGKSKAPEGQVGPAAETSLPSAVPRLGPCSPQTAPFRGQRSGGALCLADVQGQLPSTNMALEAHPHPLDFCRWEDGTRCPTDQDPWACGRPQPAGA